MAHRGWRRWSVSGALALLAGLPYGAASVATDGGFGGFMSQLTVQLLAVVNGTTDWSPLDSFACKAIHEMTVTGKELTTAFYNVSST